MDLELHGKAALVTGGTRGIGRAIAHRLAAEGCAVAVCARGAEGVGAAVDELRAAGARAWGEAVDVTDDAALTALVDAAAAALGGLDLAVANAGGAVGGPTVAETTGADWATTFALNTGHAATLARAATPHLRARGGGALLLISSISGHRPQPRSQYAAAKAAMSHLAASLARELAGDGIRVNALSPGSILFPGGSWDRRREADPEALAAWVERELPFGRLGTLDEVADVAAFLLSARASWVSGADLVVDGAQNAPSMGGF